MRRLTPSRAAVIVLLGVVAGILTWLGALSLLAMLTSGCASGAQLTLRGTAPTQDNAGVCIGPILVTMGSNPFLKIHARYWSVGQDSTTTAVRGDSSAFLAPGAPFAFSFQVPAGIYRGRAWAKDLGGVSCDTTITVAVPKDPPHKVKDLRP